jgi:hypothetical protein
MNQYVVSILTVLLLTPLVSGQATQHIKVKVIDGSGTPLPNADVVAILKSGAYQDTKFENGEYKCESMERCVKIFAAAPGFEAGVKGLRGPRASF